MHGIFLAYAGKLNKREKVERFSFAMMEIFTLALASNSRLIFCLMQPRFFHYFPIHIVIAINVSADDDKNTLTRFLTQRLIVR